MDTGMSHETRHIQGGRSFGSSKKTVEKKQCLPNAFRWGKKANGQWVTLWRCHVTIAHHQSKGGPGNTPENPHVFSDTYIWLYRFWAQMCHFGNTERSDFSKNCTFLLICFFNRFISLMKYSKSIYRLVWNNSFQVQSFLFVYSYRRREEMNWGLPHRSG